MEINGGRIKPTSKTEALAYHRFLKQQESDRSGDPLEAAVPEVNEWLPEVDSFRLFCAMEKSFYSGMDIEPKQVMGRVAIDSLAKMAGYTLGGYQASTDSFGQGSIASTPPGQGNIVVVLASQAVRPAGE